MTSMIDRGSAEMDCIVDGEEEILPTVTAPAVALAGSPVCALLRHDWSAEYHLTTRYGRDVKRCCRRCGRVELVARLRTVPPKEAA